MFQRNRRSLVMSYGSFFSEIHTKLSTSKYKRYELIIFDEESKLEHMRTELDFRTIKIKHILLLLTNYLFQNSNSN